METYNPSQAIIAHSLNELRVIAGWARDREENHQNQTIILIGGWAVHSYNSYFGSIDIDLYTNSRTKSSLMNYLKRNHGFKPHGESEINASVCKNTSSGEIIIDFLSDSSDITFKGRRESFGFNMLKERSVKRTVDGDLQMVMPDRTLLLIYKLKALWDRTWMVDNEHLPNSEYLKGKIVKDGSDILALIDPRFGGEEIDLRYLGEQLKDLDFVKDQLRRLPENRDSLDKYGKLDTRAVKYICQTILLQIS